jgi:hypothetical protein
MKMHRSVSDQLRKAIRESKFTVDQIAKKCDIDVDEIAQFNYGDDIGMREGSIIAGFLGYKLVKFTPTRPIRILESRPEVF